MRRTKRSGTLAGISGVPRIRDAGTIAKYFIGKISFCSPQISTTSARDSIDTVVLSLSRRFSVKSITPDLSHVRLMLDRMLAVRWSIWSTTTDGDGGRRTSDAKERLDLGLRDTSALLCSGSELSLSNKLTRCSLHKCDYSIWRNLQNHHLRRLNIFLSFSSPASARLLRLFS